ncbi:hypothetical protein [Sansalvadorimonas verongulae]|uniref:hypothetical protein n=1 Tax=Sansalvadorimonas verongulae TaxID=2172824 RepID=UPI0012BB5ACC|nr:hypothetical protein [Sansalvadorimonas verongulae]MTI11999.1 hypothetical protein [Sansalvadorimonas verongulae]
MSDKVSSLTDDDGRGVRTYLTDRFCCCSDGVVEIRKARKFRKYQHSFKARANPRKIWKQRARNKKGQWTP